MNHLTIKMIEFVYNNLHTLAEHLFKKTIAFPGCPPLKDAHYFNIGGDHSNIPKELR